MAARIMPHQDYLREAIDYDPLTGALTWRVRPISHFVSTSAWKAWNTKYSSKSATNNQHKFGHWQVCLQDQNWLAHRLIWKWMTGNDPVSLVDHRDDPSDNSWNNLRESGYDGNARNRKLMRGRAICMKGVYKVSESNRFGAHIRVDGKIIKLGSFVTPEEAHAAYCEAAKNHFGEFWNPG